MHAQMIRFDDDALPAVKNTHCRVCGKLHKLAFQETSHPDYAPGFWEVTCDSPGCPLGRVGYTFADQDYADLDLSTHVWHAVNHPGAMARANGHG